MRPLVLAFLFFMAHTSRCRAARPVFRRFKQNLNMKDIIEEYDSQLVASSISLLECLSICLYENNCTSVYYGNSDMSCYHRRFTYTQPVSDWYSASGFVYYYLIGTSATLSTPSTTEATSNGTCSKTDAVYVTELGTCLYMDPSFTFSYSMAFDYCAVIGGRLIELDTAARHDAVMEILTTNNTYGINTENAFWTDAIFTGIEYQWTNGECSKSYMGT